MHSAKIGRRPVQTVALFGSYVPRQCGIATFTKDLREAIADNLEPEHVGVVAINDNADGYDYPDEVRFEIRQHHQSDYRAAADLLNIEQTDLCILQHEYGLFGGKDGTHVLEFARRLRMPVVTTLHTVLEHPTDSQRAVLRELARISDRVVVMSKVAEGLLEAVYGVIRERVSVIPHGIPDVPFIDSSFYKEQFGVGGRRVLLTFGLLGPGKGIEVAIRAMPRIVEQNPDVVYMILGATHPHVVRNEGNAYRDSLERLVDQLGVRDNVEFHSRYVTPRELRAYLGAADVYVIPYPNRQQITSGTLAYAVGSGKAVVSTPFWHAEELLAEGRGRLFPFGDPEALANEVNTLLADEAGMEALRKRAYQYGRPLVWREVGLSYLNLGAELLESRARRPRPLPVFRRDVTGEAVIPELKLDHLRRLSDDVGILQHAIHAVPDRNHGYCTDDNSRALLAALLYYDNTQDASVLPLADRYLSFIYHAYNPQVGRFRNFMSYDRRWLEDVGSEDVHGRTIWALGATIELAPSESIRSLAVRLFSEAIKACSSLTWVRAWAFSILGLERYLRVYPGDSVAQRLRTTLAGRLSETFDAVGAEDWPWCEDVCTYDNAKLPHALISAGYRIGDQAMRDKGLRALDWVIGQQIGERGRVSLIGNDGWLRRDGHRARFDQQPIEAMATIEACASAFKATGDTKWKSHARAFFGWFLGNNDTQSMLYDYQSGGCRDGLHPDGPNLNQGAESTLAWIISHLTFVDLQRVGDVQAANGNSALPAAGLAQASRPLESVNPTAGPSR